MVVSRQTTHLYGIPQQLLKAFFFYSASFNERAGCGNTNDTEIIKNINPR